MELSVDNIVHRVQVNIDEIALNDAEFVDGQDNSEMEEIIIHKIQEALRYVLENADWQYLEPNLVLSSMTNTGSMNFDGKLVGRIELPDKFIRLCYAKFESWPLYVSDLIYWNDKEYATLKEELATGTWERPKVAMVMNPKKTLELYSAKESGEAWSVGLMVEPDGLDEEDIASVEDLNIPDKLVSSFINYLSGLVCVTYQWENAAENFFNLASVKMVKK